MDGELLSRIASIIVIDLVLSGDNAVVIGLAARRLNPAQRRRAIIWGGAGAVGLRILFTALAAVLLKVPLIEFVGGLLLIWIAFKLLQEEPAGGGKPVREGDTLADAIRTIILADLVMSLDNILAVGGVAHGELQLLLFGLGVSMPIILFGSNLVAYLTARLPWLAYVGSGILAWTAAEMMQKDDLLGRFLPHSTTNPIDPISAVLTALTLLLAYLANRRRAARHAAEPT